MSHGENINPFIQRCFINPTNTSASIRI